MTRYYHPAFIQRQAEALGTLTGSLPDIVASFIKAGHANRMGVLDAKGSPVGLANRWARAEVDELRACNIHRAYDETAIRDISANRSRTAGKLAPIQRSRFVAGCGIDQPSAIGTTPEGRLARMACPRWWRRRLRFTFTRSAEDAVRRLGMIRNGRTPVISDHAVYHRRERQRRMQKFLESHVMENDEGVQLELLDIAKKSNANPALRRIDFTVRCRGFEEIADERGDIADFYTLTCPSTFHAQLQRAGENPTYERQTVREAQAWLCATWAKARSKLKRLGITFYGMRIVEPHHDGTPHWHALLFYPPHQSDTVRRVLRGYWLSLAPDEPGAAEHRIKFVEVDKSKGSATGYIAKYISKNLDGYGSIGNAVDGETGERVNDGTDRVVAWATTFGIRQFAQLGGPPVTLWRETRRLREPDACDGIEAAREPANRGDFRGFINALGGIGVGRNTNIVIAKATDHRPNFYGEPRPPRIIGIRYAWEVRRTHGDWQIKPRAERNLPGDTALQSAQGAGHTEPHAGGHSENSGVYSVSAIGDWFNAGCAATGEAAASRETALRSGFSLDSVSGKILGSWLLSALGPVAITVRADGDPAGWTNPNETSMYGPR